MANVSIIRSIFWASPGSRKLQRNCLGEEQGLGGGSRGTLDKPLCLSQA